jgi:hypothetical protein
MFLSLNGAQIMTLYYKQLSGMRCGIQQNCCHVLEDAGIMCALVVLYTRILQFLKQRT